MVEEYLEQIPYMLLTIVVMAAIFFLVNFYTNVSIDPTPVVVNTFYYRTIYSPQGISLMDGNGRVHAGTIDMSRFNDQTLDATMKFSEERHLSARLDLYDANNKMVASANYNKLWFERLEPLARAGITGIGSAQIFTKEQAVVIHDKGVLMPGKIKMAVILPNG